MLEHHCTVHRDYTHHESVSIGGAAPWVTVVPEVVRTGEPGPGGDVDSGKVRGNGEYGGGGDGDKHDD